MPISGTYEWSEKKDQLILQIPLKGVNPSKVDIFVTSSVLKVNYLPYIIDIVLHGSIDSSRHKAKVKNGVLSLTLFKTTNETWGNIEYSDEDKKQQIRLESLSKHEEFEEKMIERRKEKKYDDEKHALKKQMAIDEDERNRLDSKKEEEKKQAEADVYATLAEMERKRDNNKSSESKMKDKTSLTMNDSSAIARKKEYNIYDIDEGDEDLNDMEDKIEEVNSRMISDFVSSDSKVSNDQSVDEDNIRYIPPPRSVTNGSENGGSNAFGITFTPRIFPTPMRESKASEEEDWIAKNRKHLKHHGVFGNKITKGNGVDITEEDPAWLKAKADDFFRSGDYLSAVNAYSAVVDMDDPVYYIPCLSNRSTCYLKLNNLNECKDDCVLAISRLLATDTNGVNIMFEDLPVDKMSIAIKLLMRRGICNCQLGQFHDSIEDYSQALKLVTLYKYKSGNDAVKGVTDETIGVDIDNLSKLETADNLKKNADSQLATGAFDDAERLYSEALIKVPAHVGCLSNRAACKMAKHNFNGCVDDCTIALNIFDSDDIVNRKKAIGSSDGISMLSAILPPYGSDKRKSWYLKTLTRRGAAYVQLKDLDSAIADFGKASSLDSSDKQLQKDLNSLITLRAKKNQSEQN